MVFYTNHYTVKHKPFIRKKFAGLGWLNFCVAPEGNVIKLRLKYYSTLSGSL